MNAQLLHLLARHTLAAFVVAAGLLGATHYHFADHQATDEVHASVSTCSCHSHRHTPTDSQAPAPSSDDCHFCKLLTQLSAESPTVVELRLSCLVMQAGIDLDVAQSVAVAAVYMGRGPPQV